MCVCVCVMGQLAGWYSRPLPKYLPTGFEPRTNGFVVEPFCQISFLRKIPIWQTGWYLPSATPAVHRSLPPHTLSPRITSSWLSLAAVSNSNSLHNRGRIYSDILPYLPGSDIGIWGQKYRIQDMGTGGGQIGRPLVYEAQAVHNVLSGTSASGRWLTTYIYGP